MIMMSFTQCYVEGKAGDSKTEKFNIKPNTPSEGEVSLGPSVCRFSANAVGGTNEDWEITLTELPPAEGKSSEKDESGKFKIHYSCTISRPGTPSYLYFNDWLAELRTVKSLLPPDQKGAKARWAIATDSTGAQARDDYYMINPKKGTVESSHTFTGSLNSLTLRTRKAD